MADSNVTVETRETTMDSAQLLITPTIRRDLQALAPADRASSTDLATVTRRFGHVEWAAVCERIQDAAQYIQEMEANRRQQDMQAQAVFSNLRDEVAAANARAIAAERMLAEMQQRASTIVKTLEEKLQNAEERAKEAEEWLVRISDAVRSNLNFP